MFPSTTPTVVDCARAATMLRDAERRQKRQNRILVGLGLVFTVGVPLVLIGLAWQEIAQRTPPEKYVEARDTALLILGGFMAMVYLLGIFTRPQDRSDVAREVLRGASREAVKNPLLAMVVVALMLSVLGGVWCLCTAVNRWFVRWRIGRVDDARVAVMLATIAASPLGVPPARLQKHGESPRHLRRALAYLVLFHWVTLTPDGHVTTLSRASRALRSPALAGVFG